MYRQKYQSEYMRKRYNSDPEFRERVKKAVKKSEAKRYKEGRTWKQQHPDWEYQYFKGYSRGKKKAMETIINIVCPHCKKELEKRYIEIVWRGKNGTGNKPERKRHHTVREDDKRKVS